MAGSTGTNSGGKNNVLGVQRQKPRPQQHQRSKDDIRLSKRMSKTLRHHPPACIDSSGWVPLNDLVAHIGIAKSAEQVLRVVDTDEKGRFEVYSFLSCSMETCLATEILQPTNMPLSCSHIVLYSK